MGLLDKLGKEKIDMLGEAGNIGAGNAVNALSQLLGKPVNMSISKVSIKQLEDLSLVLGDEEDYIAAMLIEVHGDLNALLLLALENKSAHELVSLILEKEGLKKEKETFNELDYSVLCETGNILAGSYLGALGTLVNLDLIPSVPQMALDMAGAILSFAAMEFVQQDHAMMLIETQFEDSKNLLNGTYILVLDEVSLNRITHVLGALI